MIKKCDNKSVGILVRKDSHLLLIERKNPPYGFAPPAGHVDDLGTFRNAAIVELKEEVGLDIEELQLRIEGRVENPCRREGGSWHYWKIYEAEFSGEIEGSERETKQVGWHEEASVQVLGKRTEEFRKGLITEADWENSPGIEPVWYDWFIKIGILDDVE